MIPPLPLGAVGARLRLPPLPAAAMFSEYVRKILRARVYDVAVKTPLDYMPRLSERLGHAVHLKREDLQPVFSFKLRGAYNKMVQLTAAERAAGVIASSAGNHAQGVALAAGALKCQAVIVMPRTTPEIKVRAVRRLGARIVLHGDNFDAASAHAQELAVQRGLTMIHPFDDPEVIAGQGTIAMEMLQQHRGSLDAVFIPVGGGGLFAGMASYLRYVQPDIRLIAVEPADAPTLKAACEAGHPVRLEQVGLFADGVAVREIGRQTFPLAREAVDEHVLVSTDEICAAIRDIYEDTRCIAEPAGALAVAGIKRWLATRPGEDRRLQLAGVLCGANMNFDRLRHIAERTELGDHREALLAVTIPERPGSFQRFCRALGARPITEFNYRYADAEQAHVFLGVRLTRGGDERERLLRLLERKGYAVVDLTDNEMAKLHLRYLVGGHAPHSGPERLFRFEFPERPGALLQFLTTLGRRWNITLFHYRNHGADYGRVLVALQGPAGEADSLEASLAQTGYPFVEESDNPAYRFFLGG